MEDDATYLLSVRFSDMEANDSMFLTDGGAPFDVNGGNVDHYAQMLYAGEGFIGDFANLWKESWDAEEVFAHKLGEPEPIKRK